MVKLLEGLRAGDLEDLVLPLLSIDEYESKIDESAIVIGFYVSEQGAAEDLNRFLQRSPVEILDTEISPAPDAQGNFMVFVELLNTTALDDNITGILEEVAALTNIETWNMKLRGVDKVVPFDAETIKKAIKPETDMVRESVLSFLTQSDLIDARFEAGTLVLETARDRFQFEVVDFGEAETVMQAPRLTEEAFSLGLADYARSKALAGALGRGWEAHRVAGLDLLQQAGSSAVLLLRA